MDYKILTDISEFYDSQKSRYQIVEKAIKIMEDLDKEASENSYTFNEKKLGKISHYAIKSSLFDEEINSEEVFLISSN